MNKRLQMLEAMTSAGQADAFGWYALAMEYRREKLNDKAQTTFAEVRQRFPEYLPTYLMEGQLLTELGETDAARQVLQNGAALAEAQGNAKALGELEEALGDLG